MQNLKKNHTHPKPLSIFMDVLLIGEHSDCTCELYGYCKVCEREATRLKHLNIDEGFPNDCGRVGEVVS